MTSPGVIYLIWSNKRRAWFKPGAAGYTNVVNQAGRYSEAEAVREVVASAMCGRLEQVCCMVAAPDNWDPKRLSQMDVGE